MNTNPPAGEDHEWLRSALGGDGSGAPVHMLARPNASAPELLLPLDSSAAAATSLLRFHDGRSARQRVETVGAHWLARLGLLERAPGTPIEIPPFAVVEELQDALGEPALLTAITLGPRRRNRKPVLQLLRPDGTCLGFAKIGWSPFTRELVANEAHWLKRVADHLPDSLNAPRVLYERDNGEQLLAVTSPLPTPVTARRTNPLPSATVVGLARSLGSSVVRIGDLDHLASWRTSPVADLVDIDRLLDRHGDTTIEVGLWHGDLTRWNTATTRRGTMLWDWEFADADRPVGFDLFHQTFEQVRRDPGRDERAAIAEVLRSGHSLLDGLDQPVDAALDLYLCELIAREVRLQGEGWDPAGLGPLDTVAAARLEERLR